MKKLLFIFNFRTFCHFCALQAQSVAGSLKQHSLFCLLMMAMFLPQVVSAAVVYWTGTSNSDWNTASNWTTGALPTSADDVYIHAGTTPSPVISSGTITVRSVQIGGGRNLTVNSGATLRIIGDAGSAFAILMMTDASSVVNNGTIALEASTGGPTTGWMIPSATTTFTNNGTLRINTTFVTAIEAGHNLNNAGQATGHCAINNNACGKIIITAGDFMIYANTVSNVTNAGLIQVTANINGSGNFTNQSGGVFIRGGGSQAITNNNGSIIVNNNPTNSTIFTYTGTFTGTVNGIYTDSAGTISAGTFTAPNTFSPSGLPTGAQTLYAKITPSGGACSYVVPFTYTMIAAPSITTQPTSGSTCAGSSRTFTVAASNSPTYQWQVSTGGSFTNLSNTSPYSNVTGASLNISNVAGLNGYQYRCIATNGGGSDTSNAAILTVNTAPAITTQPTAQTTCAGSSVSFSVAATGTGLSYQWKKGTTNVGTNSATYTIASPVVGDAGNYSVVVSGTCGSPETSNSVALTINPFALRAYVNGAVASSGDGTSWATAVKTIEEGMNVCGVEEVWVATGTYKPTKDPFGNTNPTDPRDKTFYIKDGIEIYGGFAGTETLLSQRNITANITTLSGDFNDDDVVTGSGSSLTITGNGENAYHVVLASTTVSGAGVTIDGFSIIGGHANGSSPVSVNGNNIYRYHGGGILAYRGTNTLTNNTLSGNSANSYPNDAGGGICAFYGTNTITNNILSRNRASYYGGGICAFYGTNTITDNDLSGNRANTNGGGIGTFIGSNNTLANNTLSGNSAGYGGGIYTNNSTNTLTNNTLLGNSASEGGGIYTDISTNTITNNTLSGNSSGNGGGIYIGNGTNTLTNNTLSGNWAANGGGVYTNNGTNAFINNIFWGNKKGTNANILAADYFATNTNGNIFTNNLLQLATSNYPIDASLPYGIGTAANGNIFAQDPLFVNAADIDGADDIHRTTDDGLRLSTCSPAINVGTNTNAPTTDILGNAIYNSLKDMGAYELQANPSIAPAITTQPTAQTTCVGSSVSFSVAATGTGLSYQWKKGTTNVGTNSATYTIASPVVGDAGNYSVVVSGTCGLPETSNSVALTVNTAPTITTQPTAQTTCIGSSVSFSVAATGTGLSYQWKKGAANVGTNSATYTIASPVVGDAGNYSVVVSGTCGLPETSNSVALTVNTALTITTQPTAQTTCAGSSVSFSVAATGTGLSYQWKKGAANVGTNSATYTIASPVVGDAGNYSVVVSGTCGSPETSNSVALMVNTALTITTQPTAQTTCAGSSVSFSVAATGTGLSYQWKKGAANVGTNSATYTIASPVVGDAGNYSVVVSGTCGSPETSNSVALMVNTALTITTQPTAQTTCVGSSVSFSVAATGTGLSYQWKKGAANVGTNSATYTIASPVVGDAGNYSVVVSGTCGSPETSNSVALMVNTALTITTQPTAQTTCAGSSVSFSVAATGTGLSYQWKKGAANVGTNSATYTIASPVVGDAGNYSVVVSGTCGSPETSNSVALTVNTAPTIITQPAAQTTCVGSSVSFSVAATGTGLSYQWKKGAANVGTNSATYTIASPVVGDAGNYSVVVSGTCGSPETSNSVALTVNTAPTIITQPAAQTTCVGSSVSFSVAATGTGLSYQWKKGAANVGTNSATYTIASPVVGDAGNYSVVVSGTCGSPETSNSVALTVNTAPTIITQPAAQTTCVGSSVSFSVAATGTGLSYQWKKGAANVGTNSATYTIASPVVGDAGNYSVVVSGTCGSPETSNSVALTVNTAPTIITQPAAQTTCVGSSVSFSVAATGTGLSYQWKKGAANVGTNSATYTIASPVVGDAGNYSVVVSGTCGSPETSNSVALTVNTAPTITTQPTAQTTCVGSSVSFSVAATGTGLSYQWKKGTTNVGTNSATYTIASPVVGDAGNYSVVVSGTCGSPETSNSVALTVNTAPTIITQPAAQTTCVGSSVSFSVAATGTGLSYQWKKGAANVGTNSATYTIASPVVGDAGNYSVVVSGTCGSSLTSNIVLLNVNPAPNASITYPTTLCTSASATSVLLSGSNTGTYSASPAGLSIDTNTGTIMPSSSALGVYTITYTIPASGNCASFTTTTTVNIATVPPAPSISASSNNVCAGTPVTLTASPAASYTPSEYLWYKNGTAINWGYSPTFTVGTTNAGTDIYSVEIVYLGYACISAQSASTTIVKNSPNATIIPNGATTFCANNPTSLSVSAGMNSYIWKRGNTIVNIGSSTYIPTTSGNYSVKVTDVNGCSKNSPLVNIIINPLPIANAGADKSVCVGESVQIGANNNTANSYAWSPAATLSNAATAYPIASPLGTTNYTLTVTNNTTGCSKTDIVVVTIKSLPVTPAITINIMGTNATLSVNVNSSGVNAVNWYKNGFMYLSNQISNGSITVPITNTSNAYACKSIGANGCLSSFSNAINARQGDEKDGDSLIEIDNNTMSVYPNPTSGSLNVEISDTHTTNGMLYLHNAVGQVVFAKNIELLNGFTREILDLQSLAAGIYTLTFQTDNGNIVHKIVKD